MSLSDCIKCCPFTCGWEYRDMHRPGRISLAAVVLGISEDLLADTLGHSVPVVHPDHEDNF